MTRLLQFSFIKQAFLLLTIGLFASFSAWSQLPTASQVVNQMTIGWNIGNTMEVPGGETGWGNPAVTQTLINSVKAAGFNSIRIPCAWDSHANQTTNVIDAAWLTRVKQVVDYCISNNMFVVLNIHWDGGWLENHPLYSYQTAVNAKQKAYWTQIANYFKTYNEHLLFAGTNEVHADYNTPTTENITVQQSFNQTFVDAVRATGGNNSTRTLIVQTYNTNPWYGFSYFTMPTDAASNRIAVEVHNYDPYDFTLNTANNCIYWGAPYTAQSACSWAQESYIDDLFSRIKTKWINNGIPVIVGEFGAIKRTSLTGQQLSDHIASRQYYLKYVTNAALKNGIKSFYWDNGAVANGMALFDRNSGAVVDQGALDAVLVGAQVKASGTILREYWNSISGSTVASLTSNTNYPNTPTGSSQLTSLEGPTNSGDNYGSRIRGYIYPPTTGAYTFWVAGDDNADLLLSTTDLPANATKIAYTQGWTNSRQWTKYATQKSASITLTAGQRYYIEVLHKEGTGGDNLAVAWQGPSISQAVIAGNYLSPYITPALKSGSVENSITVSDQTSNDLLLYPNPFQNEINLEIQNPENVERIVIVDQLGRQIETISHANVNSVQTIGSSYKTGMYIVLVYGSNKLQSFKIIKN